MGRSSMRSWLPEAAGLAAAGLATVWLTVAARPVPTHAGADALEAPIVFVQEAPKTADSTGSRLVVMQRDGNIRVLTEGFASAADPCVSFDARRILFAAKLRPTDPWNVWEMDADGSHKIQVTQDLGDCREPVYLPPAAVDSPDFRDKVRWATFTSTAPGWLDDTGNGVLASLYALSLEAVPGRGKVLWRTTYGLGGDAAPTLLSDGRVLFSSRQRGGWALMTISWSGENLNPFYGSHDGTVSQLDACEIGDRSVVFVENDGVPGGDRAGRLARVFLRRPLHSHEVLSAGDERYRTPHALSGGGLLVSMQRPGGTFGIYRMRPDRPRDTVAVYDDPAWDDVDAVAVEPRTVPPGRIPTVEFASVLDVGELKTVGQLQCMNVYESDRWPDEEAVAHDVTAVRFVQGVARSCSSAQGGTMPSAAAPDSTWPPPGVSTRVLGEARVEEDGSFYVNVAGNVPFYLELLNADGEAVRTMRAWMWVRTGDQRGCIGCHEDKELAPENRATEALIRARPATLTGDASQAQARQAGGQADLAQEKED
jgi:hypothetical protein